MARKKRTLPKNFEELLKSGDFVAAEAVLGHCSPDAVHPKTGKTALFYPELPEELALRLLGQGADLNARDRFGLTPLHAQTAAPAGHTALYLAHGAEADAVDDRRMTPLHCAAGAFCLENVSTLLAHGARYDTHELLFHTTPPEYLLSVCGVKNIPDAVKIIVRFLECGAPVTERMQKEVLRLGNGWPSSRRNLDRETLRSTEQDLKHLYELLEVPLPEKPGIHDGYSPITVKAVHWKLQHRELWQLLVPRAGQAETIQGEAIRLSGKLAHEFFTCQGTNFNREHQNMLLILAAFFHMGTPLPPEDLSEAASLAARVNRRSDAGEAERLCRLAVEWVLLNPSPMALNRDEITRNMQNWRTQWKKNC